MSKIDLENINNIVSVGIIFRGDFNPLTNQHITY